MSSANAGETIFDNLKLIIEANDQTTHEQLSEHVMKFEYELWISDEGFLTYLSYVKVSDDISSGPSTILFFNKKLLYAVLHTGGLNKSHFKENDEVSGYQLGYFDGANNKLKRKFKKKYYEIIRNAE